MSWTYDPTDLNTTTSSGRLNSTRLMVGDTDTTDQQVQDEEITFSLGQNNNDIYKAASWTCRVLAAKYSRLVDIRLTGVLNESYSNRSKQYIALAVQIEALGKKTSGKSLGVFAGGISVAVVNANNQNTDRVIPEIAIGQFENNLAGGNYLPELNNGI